MLDVTGAVLHTGYIVLQLLGNKQHFMPSLGKCQIYRPRCCGRPDALSPSALRPRASGRPQHLGATDLTIDNLGMK